VKEREGESRDYIRYSEKRATLIEYSTLAFFRHVHIRATTLQFLKARIRPNAVYFWFYLGGN
jgi:hypothetical protein